MKKLLNFWKDLMIHLIFQPLPLQNCMQVFEKGKSEPCLIIYCNISL